MRQKYHKIACLQIVDLILPADLYYITDRNEESNKHSGKEFELMKDAEK
jgi:hypothetical protein